MDMKKNQLSTDSIVTDYKKMMTGFCDNPLFHQQPQQNNQGFKKFSLYDENLISKSYTNTRLLCQVGAKY